MNLVKIQAELKAPKNQTNNFGKYKYRSAEDIIEAVKPILNKYGTAFGIRTLRKICVSLAAYDFISSTCVGLT
jgi:hypothetical protein